LKLLSGNLGRSVIKISAVKPEHRNIRAPARVFHSQADLETAFKAGDLYRDVVAVVRFQGPKAIGMPELHKLTPILASVQARGFQVALVTDGRMSGASGKVPAAIHVTPEAAEGGAIGRIQDGDMIHLDAENGTLVVAVDAREFDARQNAQADLEAHQHGVGRDLFGVFRRTVSGADAGASVFS
jgi:phosphogluconate dehydratase